MIIPEAQFISDSTQLGTGTIVQIAADFSGAKRLVLRSGADGSVLSNDPLPPAFPGADTFGIIDLGGGRFAIPHERAAIVRSFEGEITGGVPRTVIRFHDADGSLIPGAGADIAGSFAGGVNATGGGGFFAVIPNDAPETTLAFELRPNGSVGAAQPVSREFVLGGGLELADGTFLKFAGRELFSADVPAAIRSFGPGLDFRGARVLDDLPGGRNPLDYTPLSVTALPRSGQFVVAIVGELEIEVAGAPQIAGDILIGFGSLSGNGVLTSPLRYVVVDPDIEVTAGPVQAIELPDGDVIILWSRAGFPSGGAVPDRQTFLQRFSSEGAPRGGVQEIGEAGQGETFAFGGLLANGSVLITATAFDLADVTGASFELRDFVLGAGFGIGGGGGANSPTGGNDVLNGGAGPERIAGGAGDDTIRGAGGNDTLAGQGGDDVLRGGPGDDVLRGGAGADTLAGQGGDDVLRGGGGDDVIRGGPGEDRLFGAGGDDVLRGGGGNDFLKGGAGADTMMGDKGADTMTGGAGPDLFQFRPGDGADVIRRFQQDQDKVEFLRGVDGFEDLIITQQGANALVSYTRGSILFENLNAPELDAGDFIF